MDNEIKNMVINTPGIKFISRQEYDNLDDYDKAFGTLYCILDEDGYETGVFDNESKFNKLEYCEDDGKEELPYNCINCGAILPKKYSHKGETIKCEFCGTKYK